MLETKHTHTQRIHLNMKTIANPLTFVQATGGRKKPIQYIILCVTCYDVWRFMVYTPHDDTIRRCEEFTRIWGQIKQLPVNVDWNLTIEFSNLFYREWLERKNPEFTSL